MGAAVDPAVQDHHHAHCCTDDDRQCIAAPGKRSLPELSQSSTARIVLHCNRDAEALFQQLCQRIVGREIFQAAAGNTDSVLCIDESRRGDADACIVLVRQGYQRFHIVIRCCIRCGYFAAGQDSACFVHVRIFDECTAHINAQIVHSCPLSTVRYPCAALSGNE